MEPIRIAFNTLGCKLNFSETSTISRSFRDGSYLEVGFDELADVYVINSCSVTRNAEKRCKAMVRQVMKRNPAASVAVIGCYSQINPEKLKKLPGVGLVLGNAEKFNLFEHIKRLQHDKHQYITDGTASNGDSASSGTHTQVSDKLNAFIPSWSKDDRTRSFFKVQDGCDYFCSYCTIPLARGRSRSDTIAGTIETARKIAQTDVKEIVLSGVNIGDFGKQHNERFIDLLKGLVHLEDVERIRISSVEPDLLHEEIIELIAGDPKLMPHFHIPLQAGCNEVLTAMGRRYDTLTFSKKVDSIRKHIPEACIAVDLIVGFPAETQELFRKSLDFMEEADISYLHVFTYSERDHTRAMKYTGKVSHTERHERSAIMRELSNKKRKQFYLNNMGKEAIILWEGDKQNGLMSGFTENYIKAKTSYDPMMVNQLHKVRLNNLDDEPVYLI